MYNNKYIQTKINLCNKHFYGNKTSIEGEHYTCFSLILLDSIVNVDKRMQICNKEEKDND